MIATSHTARGEPVPRPRQSAVTDQGGLLAGRTIHRVSATEPTGASAVGPGQARPASVLTAAAVATVVATAARAPSVHNTQPWRFHVAGEVIELHADLDHLLTQIDPAGRELMISCGAALFGLRLGLRQLGYLPAVEPWPDPAQPWLVARAWPEGPAALNAVEAELLAAVPHRHTHRGPFTPGEVSPRLLAALAADAAAEGSELMFIEQPDLVRDLSALVELAAAEQEASAEMSAETRRWRRPAGSEARDGVPARAAAAGGEPVAPRFRQRDFGGPAGVGDSAVSGAGDAEDQVGEPPAVTAVLVTAGDSADDWVHAGQALNRLLLRAETRWVFASLQSQPLESPRYRGQVRELLALGGQPQMLLQFGRANTAAATPRRQQAEFRTNENQP
jgi:nitroreductase